MGQSIGGPNRRRGDRRTHYRRRWDWLPHTARDALLVLLGLVLATTIYLIVEQVDGVEKCRYGIVEAMG